MHKICKIYAIRISFFNSVFIFLKKCYMETIKKILFWRYNVLIKQICTGSLNNFIYIIGCDITKEAVVIDPCAEINKIADIANANSLNIKYIFNTHYHADHTNGNAKLKKITGAKILIHKLEVKALMQLINIVKIGTQSFSLSPYPDIIIDKEESFKVGDITFDIIFTPGHTAGGLCFFTEGNLFTGDTLFVGDSGRTDLPGGNRIVMGESLRRLFSMYPDDTIIWPGHDYGSIPYSTIGRERQNNKNAKEYGFSR